MIAFHQPRFPWKCWDFPYSTTIWGDLGWGRYKLCSVMYAVRPVGLNPVQSGSSWSPTKTHAKWHPSTKILLGCPRKIVKRSGPVDYNPNASNLHVGYNPFTNTLLNSWDILVKNHSLLVLTLLKKSLNKPTKPTFFPSGTPQRLRAHEKLRKPSSRVWRQRNPKHPRKSQGPSNVQNPCNTSITHTIHVWYGS